MEDMFTKNRSGKALLSLPKGSRALPPRVIENADDSFLVAITNEGRMLAFHINELPELARGKGNKIINIPSARIQSRDEYVLALVVISESDSIKISSGKRHLTLKNKDLEHYFGERGRRGNKLPRGFQKVDEVEVMR